jgi:hypothetical protein
VRWKPRIVAGEWVTVAMLARDAKPTLADAMWLT